MKIKEMTLGAMVIAIIAMMSLVPNLGFIFIGAVKITTIHIVVLVVVLSFNNLRLSVIAGTVFGLGSWFNALSRPVSFLDIYFMNPLVSVLPRIVFAVFAYYLYQFLIKVIKKSDLTRQYICIAISVLFHAVAVLSILYVFAQQDLGSAYLPFIMAILASNTIFEIALALFIGPILIKAMRRISGTGRVV